LEKKALLRIKDLSYTYGKASRPALDGLNLDIYEGEHTAILGANGSGKSTLLNCVNGLCMPPRGAVSVFGGDGAVFDPADETSLEHIRRRIGTVLQNPDDQIVATVVEADTAFGPENLGLPPADIQARVDRALQTAGLELLRGKAPQFLSGGERQRLAIAGILAMECDALALDEALSMIDPGGRESLLSLLDTLAGEGKTILQVTHSLEEAFRCSRCVVLKKGALVFDGTPTALLEAPELEEWGFRLPESVKAIRLFMDHFPGFSVLSLDPAETAGALRRFLPDRIPRSRAGSPADTEAAPQSGGIPTRAAAFLDGVSHDYLVGTAFASTGMSDISLEIRPGQSVALIGTSGSGKSTLLKHINALLLPSRGNVWVFGQNTLDRKTDLRFLRLRVSLAVQNPESALFETYAADDAAYGPRNAGLKGKKLFNRVADALDKAGLPVDEYGDRECRALSGGEKRRLALAGVLAMDGEMLLLDEPAASLDGKNRGRVLALIQECRKQGKTVIATTHSMEMAASFDVVAVMVKGRLAGAGTPREIFGPRWDKGWGLNLPWTVSVARHLAGYVSGEAVPLFPEELFSLVQGVPGTETKAAPQAAASSPSAAGIPPPPKHKRRKTGAEFFRNMTFGQFLGRPSALRKLGAGKKLLILLFLALTAIAGPNLLFPLGVLAFTLAAGAAAGRVEPKHLLRGFIPAAPYLTLLVLFQLVFSQPGDASTVLLTLGPVSVTVWELFRGAVLISQLGALMTLLSLYTAVTPLRETLAAVNKALLPLARTGFPARDVSLVIGIALRFVPVLTEEAERIVTAQLSRGGRGGMRSAFGMIIPLFLRALERSETLAKAMVLRLYHN
jgi:energy-coupling factor transport system ATP-binding protein